MTSLKIPVGANIDEFKRGMDEAANRASHATRIIVQSFANMNTDIVAGAAGTSAAFATGWAQAAARVALRVAAIGVAIVGTAKLISSVVNAAREQLAEMVDIAERAQNVRLSPEFFQAFTAAGRGAIDVAKTLEGALESAFKATRPSLDTDSSSVVPERLKEKWSDVEIAITRAVEIMQGASQAPLQFLGTEDQDVKVRAALETMRDLFAVGQRLEALNIGEKMFGRDFTDSIRQGKIQIEDLIRTIDEKLRREGKGPDIFANEDVRKAKELDDRLNEAWQTIEDNLKPSIRSLAEVVNGIKTAWTNIVELIARASNLLPKFQFPKNAAGVPLGPSGETSFMLPPEMQAGVAAVQAAQGGAPAPAAAATFKPPAFSTLDVIRRIGRAPKDKETSETERNDFDRQVESINRHIAALQADAAAVGMTEAAHATLRGELSLLQALEREGDTVTNEQIATYARLRQEMSSEQALAAAGINLERSQAEAFRQTTQRLGEAATAAQTAKNAFQGLHSSLQFAGSQIADVLDTIGDKSKSMADTVKQAFAAFKKAAIDALIFGGGPLAGIFGTRSNVAGGTGGILGTLFGGARASGGPVVPGRAYLVNENTPRSELFIPRVPGTIVPAGRAGGGLVVSIVNAPQYQAGMTPTDIATIEAMQNRNNAELEARVVGGIREGLANDSKYLSGA